MCMTCRFVHTRAQNLSTYLAVLRACMSTQPAVMHIQRLVSSFRSFSVPSEWCLSKYLVTRSTIENFSWNLAPSEICKWHFLSWWPNALKKRPVEGNNNLWGGPDARFDVHDMSQCARTCAHAHKTCARIWCSCVHASARNLQLCISRDSSHPSDSFPYLQKWFLPKYLVTRSTKQNFFL